jgi:hypothetical protein
VALRNGSTTALPRAVQGWSAALAALEPRVVHALAPLLQRLDELVARHVDIEGPDGEPEGYGGLTTRGTPERLLASEWALADAAPDEFLRRAAARELLHVETAFRHDPPGAVTRVVVDTGPAQAGAARLVQLAALVVLHRRAAARGARLELSVLGQPPGSWFQGDLPELLHAWLTSRQVDDAGPGQVAERHDADPAAWFVVRPGLVDLVPVPSRPVRRVLAAHEGAWSADGVVEVDVVLAGERVRLPVPPSREALRVLRGHGFRREAAAPVRPTRGDGEHVLRDAVLTSAGTSLVGRGRDAYELVTARLTGDRTRAVPRALRFPGTVVAAGATGRRLVVLHAAAGGVTVTVLGKHLGTWDGTRVEGAALRIPEAELAGTAVLASVHQDQRELWVGWPSGWRLLSGTDGVTVAPHAVAVVPRSADGVAVAMRTGDRVVAAGFRAVDAAPGARVVGGGGWLAVEVADGTWRLVHPHHRPADVELPAGSAVVGLVVLAGTPQLVTVSPGGLLLRLAGSGAAQTLTSLCGTQQKVAVHQVRPLLARDVGAGEIELHDLERGVRLGTYPGNLA